jgi:hypothetical protein
LRRLLPEIARRHAGRIVELGIVRNHVHLVIELPSQIDIPRLVQGLKGASARIANRDGVMPRAKLQWATGYDLRSLGVRDLRRAIRYVRAQADRHPELALVDPRAESPGSALRASLRTPSEPSAPSQGANNTKTETWGSGDLATAPR